MKSEASKGRGKLIAGWGITGTILVLVVVGFLYRDSFMETWYLGQLDNEDPNKVVDAVERLGNMKSERAVVALGKLMETGGEEASAAALNALKRIRGKGFEQMLDAFLRIEGPMQEKVGTALSEIEPPVDELIDLMLVRLQKEDGFTGNLLFVMQELLSKHIEKDENAALATIREMVKSPNPSARRIALEAIAAIGIDADKKIPLALEALGDPAPEVRDIAIRYLGTERAWDGLPGIVNALKDEASEVRQVAALALRPFAEWADEDAADAEKKGAAPPNRQPLSDAVPILIHGLEKEDIDVAAEFANTLVFLDRNVLLELIDSAKPKSLRILIPILAEQDFPGIAERFAKLLERYEAKKEEWTEDENDIVLTVILALSEMEERAEEAVPTLVALLDSKSQEVRWEVAMALGEIGSVAKDAAPVLIELLATPEKEMGIRQRAAIGLKGLGPEAAVAIPTLVGVLDNEELAGFAADALGAIGAPALPHLAKLLNHKDDAMRFAVAESIGQAGPDARSVAPALIESLKDPILEIRVTAMTALGNIGLHNDDLWRYPELQLALFDEEFIVRFRAAELFAKVPDEAAGTLALGPLLELANDTDFDPSDRLDAIFALQHVGKPAVDALVKLIADEEPLIREQSIRALGEIGPDAKAALSKIGRLTNHREEETRQMAREAVDKIKGIDPNAQPAPAPGGIGPGGGGAQPRF